MEKNNIWSEDVWNSSKDIVAEVIIYLCSHFYKLRCINFLLFYPHKLSPCIHDGRAAPVAESFFDRLHRFSTAQGDRLVFHTGSSIEFLYSANIAAGNMQVEAIERSRHLR